MDNPKRVLINNETAIVIDDNADCRIFGHVSLYDNIDATVMFANLTNRDIVVGDDIGCIAVYPLWKWWNEGSDEVRSWCRWLGISTELAKKGRPSFTYEELPEHKEGVTLIVRPEVAARGVKEGRMDLIALPPSNRVRSDGEESFRLVNISGVPVVFGADDDYETSIDPEPDIHPYYVEVNRNRYDVSNDVGGDYALLGLPPRKDGTLYLARWGVAVLAHMGGRTDVVGVKGSTPYV